MSQNPIPPVPAIPVLNYATPDTRKMLDRPAFNGRRQMGFSGDHLFRVYPEGDSLWFIRIAGSKNQAQQNFAMFGLIGYFVGRASAKREKKAALVKMSINETRPVEVMMAEHKRNHRIPLANIINPRIENGGFWGGNVNRLVFNDASAKNKKLMYTFDESEDIASALQYLNAILPNLQVSIEYNAAKNKYVKAK